MKKIINKKTLSALAVLATSSIVMVQPAMAQGFTGLLDGTLREQMGSAADFMSAIAYLAGVGFGIKGVLKLKEWNDSKGQQATLTQALIPFVAAGILLGLPSVLRVATQTVTDNSANSSLQGQGAIRTIN